jgi:Hint domain-containing protein
VVTRTFTIYEVPNSYVSNGGNPTISATFTMTVTDDDGFLDATAGADSGTAQGITVDGGGIDSFEFFYDDNISIAGNTETIKTFQLTINGTTRSFVMNDNASTIPGAGVGVGFSLNSYGNYTALDYNNLPCFVRGTRIDTPDGQKLIETLRLGDLVNTLDHGPQPIRWIGSSALTMRDLLAMPHMRPVRIGANSFGVGLPSRDLLVSPQHRCLLGGWQVELHFGMEQMLAPAKSLLGRKGVSRAQNIEGVEYFHLMFDSHEIVFSEGLPTESFLVGDTIRDNMDQAQLAEILALFPELALGQDAKTSTPARPVLRSFEVAAIDELVA